MTKYTFVSTLLAAVVAASCASISTAAPSALEKSYLDKIDQLMPGMAAEKIPDRKDPQQKLERMCFDACTPGQKAERAALSRAMLARCGPETPKVARVWMLRKLDPMGREEVIDGLTKLLSDDDKQIRELARRALTNNPSKRAAKSLRDALKSTDSNKCRIAMINALAWRRDTESVRMIIKLVEHEDNEVAAAAVVALGKIGSKKAVDEVENLLDDIDDYPKLRNEIIDSALRSAEHLLAAGKDSDAADIYEDLFDDIDDQGIRIAAIHGLVTAERGDALDTLIEVIDGDDARMRLIAIRCAQELSGDDVTEQLIEALDDASPATLAMLLDVLGERKDKTAQKAVIARVEHSDLQVRIAALDALKKLGNRETIVLLARRAAGTEGRERDVARDSLAGLSGAGVDDKIVTSISKTVGAVRAELIRAAAARRIKSATPEIFAVADDNNPAVRGAVIEALGVLGTGKDLPKVVELLTRGITVDSREAAENALVAVCQRIDDRETRVEPIIMAMNDGDTAAKVSLIKVLGQLQGPSALEAIRTSAKSDDPKVRQAAVAALKGWRTTYIESWLFSGAYQQDNKGPEALFDIPFDPEKPDAKVEWKPLGPKTRQTGRAFVFHLHKVAGGDNRVGYVKTTLVAPADIEAVLLFGSDDGVKAWLNGEIVHASNVIRGVTPDQEKVKVALKKGANPLMLKITQGGADWSFCCGIKALDGGPIEGLKFGAK